MGYIVNIERTLQEISVRDWDKYFGNIKSILQNISARGWHKYIGNIKKDISRNECDRFGYWDKYIGNIERILQEMSVIGRDIGTNTLEILKVR